MAGNPPGPLKCSMASPRPTRRPRTAALKKGAAVLKKKGSLVTQAQKLRDSHERFQMVVRATNDVVWDWDLGTDTIWWNGNYQTLFRYPPDAAPPTPASWTDFLHSAD